MHRRVQADLMDGGESGRVLEVNRIEQMSLRVETESGEGNMTQSHNNCPACCVHDTYVTPLAVIDLGSYPTICLRLL